MKDQFVQKLPSGLQLEAEQLVCEAEPHAKQLSPLSWAHTKDEEDTRKHMVCAHKSATHTRAHQLTHRRARAHPYTQSTERESEGLFTLVKRALIELLKDPGRETTSTSVCVCVCVRVRVIVLMKVQECVCDVSSTAA